MEIWKDIRGWEGLYQVSSQGSVRSCDRVDTAGNRRKGKTIKACPDRKGYLKLRLSKAGEPKQFKVHRLVCTAFHGPCPDGMECCHANDIRADNRADNLSWGTYQQNHGQKIARGHMTSKITPFQAFLIQELPHKGAAEFEALTGISQNIFHNIWQGKNWAWL